MNDSFVSGDSLLNQYGDQNLFQAIIPGSRTRSAKNILQPLNPCSVLYVGNKLWRRNLAASRSRRERGTVTQEHVPVARDAALRDENVRYSLSRPNSLACPIFVPAERRWTYTWTGDEQKPRCKRCTDAGADCYYLKRVTFLEHYPRPIRPKALKDPKSSQVDGAKRKVTRARRWGIAHCKLKLR